MLPLIGSIIGLVTVLVEKLVPTKMPIKRGGKIRSKNDLLTGLKRLKRRFGGKPTISEIANLGNKLEGR